VRRSSGGIASLRRRRWAPALELRPSSTALDSHVNCTPALRAIVFRASQLQSEALRNGYRPNLKVPAFRRAELQLGRSDYVSTRALAPEASGAKTPDHRGCA